MRVKSAEQARDITRVNRNLLSCTVRDLGSSRHATSDDMLSGRFDLRSALSLSSVSLAVYGILAFGCWLHLKRTFEQVVSNKMKGSVLKIEKVTLDCNYTESVVCRLRLIFCYCC